MATTKIALLRVASYTAGKSPSMRRQFKTSHRIYNQYGRARCTSIGEFAHFTMTDAYLQAIRHKLSLGTRHWPHTMHRDYRRQLAFLSNNSVDLRRHPWCSTPRKESLSSCYSREAEAEGANTTAADAQEDAFVTSGDSI